MRKWTLTLNDDYKVEVDTNGNHTLYRFKKGGDQINVGAFKDLTTKDRWDFVGHYPHVPMAIRGAAADSALRQAEEQTMTDYLAHLERISKELAESLNQNSWTKFEGDDGPADDEGEAQDEAA